MFQQRPVRQSSISSAIQIFELIYHSIVRNVRKAHGNALMAIGGTAYLFWLVPGLTMGLFLLIPAIVIPITLFGRRLRKVSRTGTVSTIAGNGEHGFADGAGEAARGIGGAADETDVVGGRLPPGCSGGARPS